MDPLHSHDTRKVPQPAGTATRVLVIDDDACVSTAIQAILAGLRCETVLASGAHEGIQAFLTSGFDVVMVDLFMPGMNGLNTITRLRGKSAVPIIAMSAFRQRNALKSGPDFLGMAINFGATISLRKPFSPPQLIAAIEQSRLRLVAAATRR